MLPNQVEVLSRLAEVSRLLDKATDDLAVFDEVAVRAKQRFEVAHARTYLAAEGSVNAREAIATIGCADEQLEAELAAARVRACRERIRTLGAQLDVGRTLSAAFRSQWAAEATGQPA